MNFEIVSTFELKKRNMKFNIEEISEIQELIMNETALMIYFFNDDCPPCLSLRPKVEVMIENEYPKMRLVFVNSKVHPEIPANCGVFSNPTLLIYFDGKESKRFSKYISISELSQSIGRYYNLIFD